jgi:LuxR family maltose regulon positive regulatory protein
MLAESWKVAVRDGTGFAMIEVLTLQALAASHEDQALKFLRQALILAEPEGYVRVFVDQGKSLIPLLRKAAQRGITPAYIAKLLAAFTTLPSRQETPRMSSSQRTTGLIPLSGREVEVLRLIAGGCSNKEIAAQLVISIGTVKRHTVNIFNKLDVKNRTEAVAHARELGLL